MRLAVMLAVALLPAPLAAAPGLFSSTGLQGWVEQTFADRAHTGYRLTRDGGVQVLDADCAKAASGWVWQEPVDLVRTPLLRWRWKIEGLPAGAAERTKPGDDFAARIYVVRKTGWTLLSLRSLVYVWAREAPVGADWPNPYTSRAHHVALRSGAGEAGRWHDEERDLRADFRRYFGIDTDSVDSVALMTDCDDTGSTARARYGDLHLAAPGK